MPENTNTNKREQIQVKGKAVYFGKTYDMANLSASDAKELEALGAIIYKDQVSKLRIEAAERKAKANN